MDKEILELLKTIQGDISSMKDNIILMKDDISLMKDDIKRIINVKPTLHNILDSGKLLVVVSSINLLFIKKISLFLELLLKMRRKKQKMYF